MIVVENLTKTYGTKQPLTVLHSINLEIEQGEFVAITGPSGSGKSTLMGLLAGLDRPSSGRVLLGGQDLTQMGEEALSRLRGEKIGFIFQNFLLVQTLTALENVMLPAEIMARTDVESRARELLARVGLPDRTSHYPSQLSGGEQQRVAIARAFINSPPILFADEPTGNLDSTNGENIVELLTSLNRESGSSLILITHNPDLAALSDREVRLKDGHVEAIVKHRKGSAALSRRSKAELKRSGAVSKPARKSAKR
jgi:putative ABC transport system ATP-binding protein